MQYAAAKQAVQNTKNRKSVKWTGGYGYRKTEKTPNLVNDHIYKDWSTSHIPTGNPSRSSVPLMSVDQLPNERHQLEAISRGTANIADMSKRSLFSGRDRVRVFVREGGAPGGSFPRPSVPPFCSVPSSAMSTVLSRLTPCMDSYRWPNLQVSQCFFFWFLRRIE
jgi:hypothetical protein